MKYLLNYYLETFPVITNATRFLPLGTLKIYGMNHEFIKCFLAEFKCQRSISEMVKLFFKGSINQPTPLLQSITFLFDTICHFSGQIYFRQLQKEQHASCLDFCLLGAWAYSCSFESQTAREKKSTISC